MRAIVLVACLLVAGQVEAANLYVNNSGSPACSDATAKASNTALAPWCTIGRAAWGNASRSSPSSGEAADDDDIVLITAGTYDYTASVLDDRFDPLYSPTNDGSSGHFITFTPVGTVVLTAGNVKAPIIGSNSKDYIKWFSNRASGTFYILACGWANGTPDICPSNTVMTKADTGPVVCSNTAISCWVEGVTIVGYAPIDYDDNWSGIRWDNAVTPTARNNTIANFTQVSSTNHNQSCFTSYHTSDGLFEHNTCDTAGAGVYFKDTGSAVTQEGNIVRLSTFNAVLECFTWSHVTAGSTEDQNDVTQNWCAGAPLQGVHLAADGDSGSQNDRIYNNTFYGVTQGCLYVTDGQLTTDGVQFWSNICWGSTTGTGGAGRQIVYQSGNVVPAANISTEHNLYYLFAQFATDGSGNLTFAQYKAASVPNDTTAVASVAGVTSAENPLFVNAAGNDFRLCTAAGIPSGSCSGVSPAVALTAGAYITNSECIGLESACSGAAAVTYGRIRRDAQ